MLLFFFFFLSAVFVYFKDVLWNPRTGDRQASRRTRTRVLKAIKKPGRLFSPWGLSFRFLLNIHFALVLLGRPVSPVSLRAKPNMASTLSQEEMGGNL